jgi:hypothetical protein
MRYLMHIDYYAARLAEQDMKDSTNVNQRKWRITRFAEWLERREGMQNAFRADLGLPPVKLPVEQHAEGRTPDFRALAQSLQDF